MLPPRFNRYYGGTILVASSVVRFQVRLDADLHRRLTDLAEREHRSLNAQIAHMLDSIYYYGAEAHLVAASAALEAALEEAQAVVADAAANPPPGSDERRADDRRRDLQIQRLHEWSRAWRANAARAAGATSGDRLERGA